MDCPMFVDYTRDCLDKIGFLPQDTFYYCQSDKHKECPFFKTLNNIGFHCDCVKKCVAYKNFGISDFDNFVKIANRYCLSSNNVNCARFKVRQSGEVVPEDLLPDGSRIKA
ncbi:MAG: hypothetical protein MUF05_07305 [Candidatus Omnitrophica bacterium]|jgi:hypothetical protein|nr:hypothetical protein [Candidatus Omnitrophota bacterium]